MLRGSVLVMLVVAVAAGALHAAGNDYIGGRISGFTVNGSSATAVLHAEPYEVRTTGAGHRISMEGFGLITAPGQPRLPMKRFLIALPAGARAQAVEVLASSSTELPGQYSIGPNPPVVPLPGSVRTDEAMARMGRDWEIEYRTVYGSGSAFPAEPAWLAGSGTLRKYAYAAVAFCPFTYHPMSGRLIHHSAVEIKITYALPFPGSDEARHVNGLLADCAGDERARSLFPNYADVAECYRAPETGSAPLSSTYDYVIITTADLVGAVNASMFPYWKASIGYSVRTVLTADAEIAGQPGGDLAAKIRSFLRSYYGTWGIEYVLLVGDYATVPMRICYPDSAFHVYNPSDPGLVAPGTPTDQYYADLSFTDGTSWDSDGDGYPGEYNQDSPDFMAEVAVGRIPVNDSARVVYSLDKIALFEQDTGAWKNQALLAGAILFFENQNHGGYPFIDGATCLDSIATGLMSGWSIAKMSEQSGIVTSLFAWPPISENAFSTAWRTGEYAIVNWSGHGWPDGAYRSIWTWDDGDGVPEHANGELTGPRFTGHGASYDDDHPSVLFAISCDVGYPDPNPYGNYGIDLLTLPGWGPSVGVVSAARPAAVSGDWKNYPGGTEQICFDFNRYMVVEGEKVGDALYDGKYYATSTYGWDGVYEYMNLYNFNLYGDPALAVGGVVSGVAPDPAGDCEILRLGPAAPSPFTSTTAMSFNLPSAGHVRVSVHDVRGREVAVLADRHYKAGKASVAWDGTDSGGRRVGPGIYFIAVETADNRAARKTILLR
jgi:hypothetical protein